MGLAVQLLSCCHARKMYGGMDVQIHALITLTLQAISWIECWTSTRKASVPDRNLSPFFQHMTLNRLVSRSGRLQGTYYLNLRGSVRLLNTKELCYFETSETAYRASQCHVPGEGNPENSPGLQSWTLFYSNQAITCGLGYTQLWLPIPAPWHQMLEHFTGRGKYRGRNKKTECGCLQ